MKEQNFEFGDTYYSTPSMQVEVSLTKSASK